MRAHSKLYLAGVSRPPRVGKSKEDREKEKKAKEARDKEKRESKEKEKEAKRTSNEKEKEKDASISSGVLRKRTLSGDPHRAAPAPPAAPAYQTTSHQLAAHYNTASSQNPTSPTPPETPRTINGAITLKPGVDVLQQLNQIVGEADHSGFMMKKGERYNTWKHRFFYLKGPHLYYLRSKQARSVQFNAPFNSRYFYIY